MALEEDRTTGNWKERSVCMGDTQTCSFPGLINQHHKFIISFAEDEAGKVWSVCLCVYHRIRPVWHCWQAVFVIQGSCTSWLRHTRVPCLLLELCLNSWTPPGIVSDQVYITFTHGNGNGNTCLGKLFKKTGVFFKQALIQVMEKKKNPGGQIIMNCT